MKRLTSRDIARRDDLIKLLNEAKEKVELAHAEVERVINDANEVISSYNDQLAEVEGFKDDMMNAMQEYMDERSDRWCDTEAGQNYSSWKDEWDLLDVDQLEMLDIPDMPDMEHAANLEDLPDEP